MRSFNRDDSKQPLAGLPAAGDSEHSLSGAGTQGCWAGLSPCSSPCFLSSIRVLLGLPGASQGRLWAFSSDCLKGI